jgi:hypothetical protein
MKLDDRVLIDLPYDKFENATLWALERDTGVIAIVPEILRLCKIAMRKEKIRKQRIKNLRGGK